MHYISRVGGFPSFFKNTRNKITKTFRVFICSLIAFQPMMIELAYAQEIVIDPSGNVGFNPTVRNTSKAPVVDIARPNTGGVSHNKFTKFNVDSKGVVLNNSATASNTSLNGSVAGNANLINGTASTIVNEVTSTGNSSLSGTTEVAGDRASVIIANPNGILCNGCNFINAGDATLTTGTPVIDGGNVRLNVTQGTVTIGRNGLNGSQNNVANINLIGRTVVVDGKVTAIDGVNVHGGAQSYDLTNKRHAATLTGVGTKSDYAVDATAFGAMEAGRIQIIGNERGLGVRTLGALQSTSDTTTVKSEGDIAVRSVQSAGDVTISARDSLDIERDVASTAGKVYLRGKYVSAADTSGVYGATSIYAYGHSGLTFGGDIQSSGDVELISKGNLVFSGYASTPEDFNIHGYRNTTISGATVVADSLISGAASTVFKVENSAVFTLNDFRIATRDFHLGKDVVVDGLTEAATSKLIVTATGAFINGSDLRRHSTADITYAGNLINEVGGIIEEAHLNIAFDKDIQNSGILYGSETLKLDVKNLFNTETGAILSKSINIDAKTLLENKGTISSEGNIVLASDTQVINSGYIQAIRATVNAPVIKNDGNGEIRLRDLGSFTATNRFDNAGILASLDDLKIITETFENKGLVSVGDVLDVAANKIKNYETLTSGSTIKLVARDDILNAGQIASFGNTTLDAADRVDNTGSVLVDGVIYVRGTGFYNTGDDALVRANVAALYPSQIKNSGKIYLINDFKKHDLDYFENTGVFATAGGIELSGRTDRSKISLMQGSSLISGLQANDTTQTLLAGKSINLSFHNLDLHGRVASGGDLSLTSVSNTIIRDQLQAGRNVYFNAPNVTLTKTAKLNSTGNARFTVPGTVVNDGIINLGGYISTGSDSKRFFNKNIIAAKGTSKFALQDEFVNSGLFQVEDTFSISALNVTNSGHLQAGQNAYLSARKLVIDDQGQKSYDLGHLVHSGTFAAENIASLAGSRITTESNAFLSAGQLYVSTGRFYNKGSTSLSGEGRNEWNISEALYQYGTTYSAGDFQIRAQSLNTYADSLITSNKTLSLSVTAGASLAGRLSANRAVIHTNTVSGSATSSIFATDDIDLRGTVSAYHRGELAAGDNVSVSSKTIGLDGTVFGETVILSSKKSTSDSSNRARIYARKTFFANTAASFYNYGEIEAKDSLRISTGDLYNYAGSELKSTVVDVSASNDITNYGKLYGAREVNLTANRILANASGGEIETVSLGFKTRRFDNHGSIDVYGLFGESYEGTTNYGSINAKTYFGLTAASVQNRENGEIHSDGHLYINTASYLKGYKNSKITGQVVDIRGSVTNDGFIQAQEVVNLAGRTGSFSNGATGAVYGKTIALSFSKGNAVNRGIIGQAANSNLPKAELVNIYANGSIANTGQIQAGDIRLLSSGDIGLGATSSITASEFLGLKSHHGTILNQGVLRAKNATLEANGDFDNRGSFRVAEALSIDVKNRVYNRSLGSVNADIRAQNLVIKAYRHIENSAYLNGNTALVLKSKEGSVSSTTDLTGQGGLQIEAYGTIDLQQGAGVANSINLLSHRGDINVGNRVETKTLLLQAYGNIKATGGSLRGKEITQLIANDIVRTDRTTVDVAANRSYKLDTISNDARGDIYVRLRNGSLGQVNGSIYEDTGHTYERHGFDVTGSVTLISDNGDVLLSGTHNIDESLDVRGRNVGIGRLTVNVGKTVHLEARHVLKNFGRVNIASASNVELVQGSGWFRTSEWLTDNQVNYDLTVQAKSIAVDSDHRFGKDLVLRAEDNIWHNDSVISANKITYAAGKDISIKFNPFKWREANPNAANANWWDTVSGGLRGHTLLAGKGGITLYAGQDVKLQSGKIHTSTSVDITAGRHIISAPWYQTRFGGNVPGAVGWSFSDKYGFEGDWTPPNSSDYDSHIVGNAGQATIDVRSGSQGKLKERRAYVNHITANGDVRLKAGKTVNLIGTYVSSRDSSIDIQATVGINIAAASGYRKYDDYWTTRGGKWPFKKTHHDTVKQYDDIYTASYLESKNGEVRLLSEGNILSAGTRILAGGDLLVKSDEGNIELGTYKERYFREHYYRKERHGLGGIKGDDSSSITIDTNFNTGNNFDSDKQLTLKTESTESALRIVGGTYNAKKVRILAAGNLYIDAAINDVKLTEFSEKGNGITITTINSGVDRESAALPEITSAEDIDFAIGGEVHIGGWRGRDLNSSLISTIGNRDFENALVNLYTPDAQATAASAAQSVNQQYLRDFDLPGASDGQQFEYLDTLVRDYGATYHTIQLRDRTWYDKQTRLSPAFQALLQIAATYVTGGLSLGVDKVLLNAAIRSASATALSGAVGGVITGNFDLGDILEDAALAGSSAYITTFLTTSIDFGAGFSDDSIFVNSVGDSSRFAPSAIVDRLGDRVISNGVSNVFNGEKFFEGIDKLGKTFLVSEALAVTQFGIGELGEGNASFEGSIGHLLLHGGAGCVALVAIDGNCAAGFFSGASQSVLAGSGLSDQQKADLVPLVGALAGFAFSDGEAINVTFGSTIATSGLENNYLSHKKGELQEFKDRLDNCQSSSDVSACELSAYAWAKLRSSENLREVRACGNDLTCLRAHRDDVRNGETLRNVLLNDNKYLVLDTGGFNNINNIEAVSLFYLSERLAYADPSALRLVKEWATGTGPEEREFLDGMNFTESFRASNGMIAARDYVYGKYSEAGGLTNDSSVTNWGYGFGLYDIVTDYTAAGQVIGSVTLETATVHDGIITYTFTNKTSLQSFLYSRDSLSFINTARTNTSSLPTSTIGQTIIITEPVDPNFCSNNACVAP